MQLPTPALIDRLLLGSTALACLAAAALTTVLFLVHRAVATRIRFRIAFGLLTLLALLAVFAVATLVFEWSFHTRLDPMISGPGQVWVHPGPPYRLAPLVMMAVIWLTLSLPRRRIRDDSR